MIGQADWKVYVFAGVGLGMFLLAAILAVDGQTYSEGYKQGQIDALTGKIKYELVVRPDSTRIWQEIEK